MSPTLQMTAPPAMYTPTSDMMERHSYGVTKNRKTASTGGGRAWSEDEEAYLLQTRLQKMPYKHIAAHLKKTELACRLHYHQLSHGSNRRKRTTSVSSGSSASGHSPLMPASMPSPMQEADLHARSVSPPSSASIYGLNSPPGIQLPRIVTAHNTSPRLPAILPKPASRTLALATATAGIPSPTASHRYPTPFSEPHPHSAPLMASASFRSAITPTAAAPPLSAHTSNGAAPGPLRLDCSALPPPFPSATGMSFMSASHPVDMGRLNAAYTTHRASFWSAVASEYGQGASAVVLEQAWRNGVAHGSHGLAAHTPITPIGSPEDHVYSVKTDKTRISAILGIDANPRSPREREMVRRMEEERCTIGAVGA